jgi:molybdenum cofactor biosynthesis enzyme MoaA
LVVPDGRHSRFRLAELRALFPDALVFTERVAGRDQVVVAVSGKGRAAMLSAVVGAGIRRVVQELREAVYLSTGADLTKPQTIGVVLTERCNYRCLSCGCWRKQDDADEMSLEQWIAAFTDVREFVGDFSVQFGGGEPFVFKPFLDLIAWCRTTGISWSMITNGSAFSPKNAQRVADAQPIAVNISVDGATAAVHDHSRGVAGSLRTITHGIETLKAARRRSGASFAIRIKPTVHRANFREMPALVRWAEAIGATSVDFSPVRAWTPEVETQLWLGRADEEDLKAVMATLIAMKRAGAPIETEASRISSWDAHFRGESVAPSLGPAASGCATTASCPTAMCAAAGSTRAGQREECVRPGDLARCRDAEAARAHDALPAFRRNQVRVFLPGAPHAGRGRAARGAHGPQRAGRALSTVARSFASGQLSSTQWGSDARRRCTALHRRTSVRPGHKPVSAAYQGTTATRRCNVSSRWRSWAFAFAGRSRAGQATNWAPRWVSLEGSRGAGQRAAVAPRDAR